MNITMVTPMTGPKTPNRTFLVHDPEADAELYVYWKYGWQQMWQCAGCHPHVRLTREEAYRTPTAEPERSGSADACAHIRAAADLLAVELLGFAPAAERSAR